MAVEVIPKEAAQKLLAYLRPEDLVELLQKVGKINIDSRRSLEYVGGIYRFKYQTPIDDDDDAFLGDIEETIKELEKAKVRNFFYRNLSRRIRFTFADSREKLALVKIVGETLVFESIETGEKILIQIRLIRDWDRFVDQSSFTLFFKKGLWLS